MVLNMADFGKFWNSPQTPEKGRPKVGNGFLTSYGLVREDLARIPNGPKSADFEQKPWAIAHGFEHGGFWQVLKLTPNSLKTSPKYLEMDF